MLIQDTSGKLQKLFSSNPSSTTTTYKILNLWCSLNFFNNRSMKVKIIRPIDIRKVFKLIFSRVSTFDTLLHKTNNCIVKPKRVFKYSKFAVKILEICSTNVWISLLLDSIVSKKIQIISVFFEFVCTEIAKLPPEKEKRKKVLFKWHSGCYSFL